MPSPLPPESPAAVPTLPVDAPAPAKATIRNPLADIAPTGAKVRVYRSNETGVWALLSQTWAAEHVRARGGFPEFLQQVVVPLFGPRPGEREETYKIEVVAADGKPSATYDYAVAAPLAGATSPPAPVMAQSQATEPQAAAPVTPDAVDVYRRGVQDERARAASGAPPAPPGAPAVVPVVVQPAASTSGDDTRYAVDNLVETVRDLARQVAEIRATPAPQALVAQPPPPAPGAALREAVEVANVVRDVAKEVAAPKDPPPTMALAPAPSATKSLEDLAAAASAFNKFREALLPPAPPPPPPPEPQRSRVSMLSEVAADVKALTEAFGIESSGPLFRARGTRGLGDAAVDVFNSVIVNADTLANAFVKMAEAYTGARTAATVNAAPGSGLPEDVRQNLEALIAAKSDEDAFNATLLLLQALQQHKEMQDVVRRVTDLVQTNNANGLILFVRNVAVKAGYGSQVSLARARELVEALLRAHARVHAAQVAQEQEAANAAAAAREAEVKAREDELAARREQTQREVAAVQAAPQPPAEAPAVPLVKPDELVALAAQAEHEAATAAGIAS